MQEPNNLQPQESTEEQHVQQEKPKVVEQTGVTVEEVKPSVVDTEAPLEEENSKSADSIAVVQEEKPAKKVEGASFCSACGTKLPEDSKFCPGCGAKSEPVVQAQTEGNSEANIVQQSQASENLATAAATTDGSGSTNQESKAKSGALSFKGLKKTHMIIGGGVAAVLIIAAVGLFAFSPIFKSADELFSVGDYAGALSKTPEDQRDDFFAKLCSIGEFDAALSLATDDAQRKAISYTNHVASLTKNLIIDNLKDSDSFVLKGAWPFSDDDGDHPSYALKIQGNNSYGQPVMNYYYVSYDDKKKEYKDYGNVSDFTEEKIYSWDSYSEKLEKKTDNLLRDILSSAMNKSNELNYVYVEALNTLFKDTKFRKVEVSKLNNFYSGNESTNGSV